MRKIKIFVDAHVFDGIPQGTVSFIAGLYSELIKDARFKLYVGSNDRINAIRMLGSDNFVHLNYGTTSKILRLLVIIPKLLKRYNIEFAHFQYICPVFKSCFYIVTIHDILFVEYPQQFPFIYRVKNSFLFYWSSRRADIITTVSMYSKKSLTQHFKIKPSEIILTPNAAQIKASNSYEVDPLVGKKFILFVSRIEPRKNQALLIKTWKELGLFDKGYHLVIVGSSGVIDTKFDKQIKGLTESEAKYFHWLERVTNEELLWLYKNCALFVFPSAAEGFGIPPLEAAVSGAKVICSNTTAMGEFGFFKGFQFDPSDVEDFKICFLDALEKEFDHEFVVSQIQSIYNWGKIALDFGNYIVQYNNENSCFRDKRNT